MAKRNNSGSAADFRLAQESAAKNLARKKALRNRTDAAGRSGMGETGRSNMLFKGGSQFSSANKTANAAAVASTKAGGDRADASSAYIESMAGAADYAWNRKR
jgi:hypothetical protein